jgi:ATP-dependent Clp protease ATP-binding subunit ClpA
MMWQRFTERARRVVFFSQEEAGRLGESYVSTEHLLLGLVRENDSVAARILIKMDVSLDRIRDEVTKLVPQGAGQSSQDMQLTPSAQQAIHLSYDEARQLSNNYIGTEHLLLGLIREKEGMAGQVLAALGVELERTRDEIREIQKQPHVPTTPGPPRIVSGTAASEIEPSPQKGDIGVLRRGDTTAKIPMVLDRTDLKAYEEVLETKDDYAYREMVSAGKVVLLEPGTQAKFLRKEEPHSDHVRVLDGEYVGRSGYVRRGILQETHADSRPFPPEI